MDMPDLHPALPIFFAAVERNLGRARRQYLHACGTPADVMLGGGIIMKEPSGDGRVSAEQDFRLILPRPSDAIRCSADPRSAAQIDAATPNASTPKHPGDFSDEPLTKEDRASRDIVEPTAGINLTDFGLPSWGDVTIRLDVNPEDRDHAFDELAEPRTPDWRRCRDTPDP